ncbi:MAG: membrane protein insertase YidC [Candidatus Aceula lacicola]|nr:membrane protein insertase YidC [Candidatus Aceula lacicola]
MEKRTFLAILLSVFILFGYNALVLKKAPKDSGQRHEEVAKDSQAFVTKEFTNVEPVVLSKAVEAKEKITIIENDIFKAEFSNIGGSLKSITIKKYNETMPVENIVGLVDYEAYPFSLRKALDNKIVFYYRDDSYEIEKIYDLSKENYLFDVEVSIKNVSGMSKVKSLKMNTLSVETTDLIGSKNNARERGLYEYSVSLDDKIIRKNNAIDFSSKNDFHEMGNVNWSAFRNRYFCAIVKPEFITKDYETVPVHKNQLDLILESQNIELDRGEKISYKAFVYVGPQDKEILSSYNLGIENVSVFSKFWILNSISNLVITTMNLIHKVVPNWGFCIIMISILFYLVTYPLTIKSMLSMKRMQALQPEITKIREQYKSNPQRLNKEIMGLYKTNSVNPMGGCLPMILQMPAFIALYQALWRTVAFKGAHFLWIKDLSQPDRLFTFPFTLPIVGNEFNILPIIMMIAMFFQQKASTKNMASTDPNQVMQQKMMTMFFPVFLGFIFYKFSSGLTLYFTMFYILSTFTQLKMSKIKKAG